MPDQLVQLLEKLKYDNDNATYRHPDPERKAIFVGDFIDRGPKIRETLSIVKSMVDNDAAYAVSVSLQHRGDASGKLRRAGLLALHFRAVRNQEAHDAHVPALTSPAGRLPEPETRPGPPIRPGKHLGLYRSESQQHSGGLPNGNHGRCLRELPWQAR